MRAGPAAPVSERSRSLPRKILVFAAVVEMGTGIALVIDPAIVLRLLLGIDVPAWASCSAAASASRCSRWSGVLAEPGARCERHQTRVRAMLVYNALIAAVPRLARIRRDTSGPAALAGGRTARRRDAAARLDVARRMASSSATDG